MLQDTANIVNGCLAEISITACFIENVFTALPHTLVNVHSRAIVLEKRLRHERGSLSVLARYVLHNVLVVHQVVGHFCEGVKAHVNLALTRRGYFVMMHLNANSNLLHRQDHLASKILQRVHGWDREITFLVADLVSEVVAVLFAPRIPEAFIGIDVIESSIHALIETYIIKHEELRFGTEIRCVPDACRL